MKGQVTMFKIEGLDQLQQTFKDAQAALSGIDGQLGEVRFDPEDPASIEKAIEDVETMVDERLGAYSNNAIVGPLAASMKGKYRQAILDKAAEARLKQETDDEQ
jgi:hypothetical protein